jgi:hypothetical protein
MLNSNALTAKVSYFPPQHIPSRRGWLSVLCIGFADRVAEPVAVLCENRRCASNTCSYRHAAVPRLRKIAAAQFTDIIA